MVAKSGAACASPCGPVTDVPLLRPDADSAGVLCPSARPPAVWLAAGAARCVSAAKLASAEMLTCAGAPCSPCNTPGNSKAGRNKSPLGLNPHGCLRAQPPRGPLATLNQGLEGTLLTALVHSVPAHTRQQSRHAGGARTWHSLGSSWPKSGKLIKWSPNGSYGQAERREHQSALLGPQAHTASKHGFYAHRRANRGHQIIHLHVCVHICRR